MKATIINLLKLLNIKIWENVIIETTTIDIIGTVSGKVVLMGFRVPILKDKNSNQLNELINLTCIQSNYLTIFFDDKSIAMLKHSFLEITKINLDHEGILQEEIEKHLDNNRFDAKLNIATEYLKFLNSLLELIDNCNYFKVGSKEHFILSLAKDYIRDLPTIKNRRGLHLRIKSTTKFKSFYVLDIKVDYRSNFKTYTHEGFTSVEEYEFYGKLEFDEGNGRYMGNEVKFLYPKGHDYQLLYSQLERYFNCDMLPNFSPLNKELLEIEIN